MELNGIHLALYPREALAEDADVSNEGQGFKGLTLAYCTRTEAEVNELFADFEKKGVTITKKPEKVF
ncbi:MAG: hypothetical protein RIG62_31845 [Cyclobacteriaceae bacterium]